MSLGSTAIGRLSTLLDEALDRDEPARAAWIAGLQGDDARFAPLLHDLLARHASQETADLLERGPAFTAPGERENKNPA